MQSKLLSTPRRCFAVWCEDHTERKQCASGGFVTLLSRYVLFRGGVVYGVRYNETWQAVYERVDNESMLQYLKGSKYTHSKINDTYRRIQEDLKHLPLVLFVGLPCQVASLYQFLGEKPDNLLTCDLFCHGTPPSSYLTEEIEYLKKRHKIKEIDDIRFRGNDGHNYYLTLWNQGQLLYRKKAQAQYYFSAFLDGISLRDACQTCAYARLERSGDFSTGDFIGLGHSKPFTGPLYNTSVVLTTSVHADEIMAQMSLEFPYLQCQERSIEEAYQGNPALKIRRQAHKHSRSFHQAVKKYGWVKASRYYQTPSIIKYYLKQLYIKCHHIAHLMKKTLMPQR
ncbi:MAG: Coenzyme F420 hydrogenase/dehydrogenase, beta subunit C-terminal domain [Bacteroidales bacterium]|nr:Coenzyme F420 hydrogenase/dehydrogenase, beta subunit C-terminal domain [Bacteroidales bacterium]